MSPLTEPTRLTLAKDFTWNESVWNPAMLGPALWLDAADASTITESGGAVSQWNDKSGNARHVIQATPSSKPQYSASQIGGLPALSFDGSDFLRSSLGFQLGIQFSVYGVLKPEKGTGWDNSDYSYLYAHGPSSIEAQGAAFIVGSQTFSDWVARDLLTFGDGYDSGRMPRAIGPVATGTDARLFSSSLGDSESFVALNGSLASTRVSGTGTRLDIISQLTLGANTNSTQWFQGKIAEFFIVSSSVTLANRQKAEGYLAHKWGLTANLPAGHPYKTVGPTP